MHVVPEATFVASLAQFTPLQDATPLEIVGTSQSAWYTKNKESAGAGRSCQRGSKLENCAVEAKAMYSERDPLH